MRTTRVFRRICVWRQVSARRYAESHGKAPDHELSAAEIRALEREANACIPGRKESFEEGEHAHLLMEQVQYTQSLSALEAQYATAQETMLRAAAAVAAVRRRRARARHALVAPLLTHMGRACRRRRSGSPRSRRACVT